jgi:hypothetical protein
MIRLKIPNWKDAVAILIGCVVAVSVFNLGE